MPLDRPLRRTCRPFTDGSYDGAGRWIYLLDLRFANEPQHYISAFLLLQRDVLDLFAYIEPADPNRKTYSHRVQQLLMRACVEVEANLKAILTENGYRRQGGADLTMADYRLVNRSHRLSEYEIRIPSWRGSRYITRPFAQWDAHAGALPWYQAYNKSKHDRHEFFEYATFEAMVDALCGLAVVLSAQFHQDYYSPAGDTVTFRRRYGYDIDDRMESAIGGYLRIKFPTTWLEAERYAFDWTQVVRLEDPFDRFDYSSAS
jgi:hypothetical protein